MHACRVCSGKIEGDYRYCPWCAAPQRAKLVEFFGGTGDEAGRALRVSRYIDERHVRFSVWDESGTAEAAVSIDEAEAQRLAAFLSPRRVTSFVGELRARAGL
ncbi:MAG TPA: hypothetical protein VNP93_12000 [Gaiellaceae bacterium]|nr:hypothetical protein [Gaiellaceae bacterium]